MPSERLDRRMVERGLVETRQKAQALIMAGEVLIDGQRAAKAGQMVPSDALIELTAKPRYVGLGGIKLAAALETFGIDVAGSVCADFGSSTGGFTDCLLQAGASRVHAIDVGTNQLDWKLRCDSRVVVLEKTNARYLEPANLGQRVDFVAMDVSFISATLVLPAVLRAASSFVSPNAGAIEIVVLVKPQFEVGRELVGKGGIVRDESAQRAAVARVEASLSALGCAGAEWIESPILGGEGNREFLLHAGFSPLAIA